MKNKFLFILILLKWDAISSLQAAEKWGQEDYPDFTSPLRQVQAPRSVKLSPLKLCNALENKQKNKLSNFRINSKKDFRVREQSFPFNHSKRIRNNLFTVSEESFQETLPVFYRRPEYSPSYPNFPYQDLNALLIEEAKLPLQITSEDYPLCSFKQQALHSKLKKAEEEVTPKFGQRKEKKDFSIKLLPIQPKTRPINFSTPKKIKLSFPIQTSKGY